MKKFWDFIKNWCFDQMWVLDWKTSGFWPPPLSSSGRGALRAFHRGLRRFAAAVKTPTFSSLKPTFAEITNFLENLILSDKKKQFIGQRKPLYPYDIKYYFSKHICLIISWKVDTFSTLGIGKNVMSSGDKRKWDCWEEYKPRISNRKFLSSNGRTSQNEKEISLFRM